MFGIKTDPKLSCKPHKTSMKPRCQEISIQTKNQSSQTDRLAISVVCSSVLYHQRIKHLENIATAELSCSLLTMKKPSVIPTYHPAYESIRNPSRPLTDARPDEEQSSSLLETDTLCVEVSAVLTPVGHRASFFFYYSVHSNNN